MFIYNTVKYFMRYSNVSKHLNVEILFQSFTNASGLKIAVSHQPFSKVDHLQKHTEVIGIVRILLSLCP